MMSVIRGRGLLLLYAILQFCHQNRAQDVFANSTSDVISEAFLKPDFQEELTEVDDEGVRTKRNHLTNSLQGHGQAGSSVPGNSVEGLLASCQLTNLLLYQILQQRASPGLGPPGGGSGNGELGNILQPFQAAGGIVNNFLLPPRLTTYITTSSYVTKLTTTAVITIPLLFGNKPSPTTITRTKTYEVSTFDVQTITTTVEPSTSKITPSSSTVFVVATSTQSFSQKLIAPTPPLEELESEEPENDFGNFKFQPPQQTNPLLNHENPVAKRIKAEMAEKYSFQKRTMNRPIPISNILSRNVEKVLRSNPATTQHYQQPSNLRSDYTDRTPAYQYSAEQYSNKGLDQSPREIYYNVPVSPIRSQQERPYGYQDEDELDDSYYTRRLKRLGEAEDTRSRNGAPLDREYLLEPSFDEASSEFERGTAPQCPPPVEITITKTITKFINPPPPPPPPTSSSVSPTPTIERRRQFLESTTNEKRSRGGRRFEVSLKAQETSTAQLIRPTSLYYVGLEPSSTTSNPHTRKRGRGDILQRARSSPAPLIAESSSENIKLQEIGGSYGEVEPGRVRQRNARKRRPQTEYI